METSLSNSLFPRGTVNKNSHLTKKFPVVLDFLRDKDPSKKTTKNFD